MERSKYPELDKKLGKPIATADLWKLCFPAEHTILAHGLIKGAVCPNEGKPVPIFGENLWVKPNGNVGAFYECKFCECGGILWLNIETEIMRCAEGMVTKPKGVK